MKLINLLTYNINLGIICVAQEFLGNLGVSQNTCVCSVYGQEY